MIHCEMFMSVSHIGRRNVSLSRCGLKCGLKHEMALHGVAYDYLPRTMAVNLIGQLQRASSPTCDIDGVFLGRLQVPIDMRILGVRLDLSCCERPESTISQLLHGSYHLPDLVDTYDIFNRC